MIKVGWRQWLLLALFALLTLWVVTRFADFSDLTNTLAGGHVLWLVVALVVHLGYFTMYAQLYSLTFGIVGVASTLRQILPVQFGALFVNGVAPSGGTAGAALFIDDANRRGESGARTAIGIVLVLLLDLATLVPFLVFGIVFLATKGKLAAYDWITSLLYVIFVSLLTAALALARWRPRFLRSVLEWLRTQANRIGGWFKHPDVLGESWAEDNANELNTAAVAIRDHPRRLAVAVVWAVLMHAANAVGLYAIFLALDEPVQPGVVAAGFSLGIVFWVVAIIPEGAGAVEGVMALVFTSLGVPKDKAAAIVLVYRAYNFYLPVLAGFLLLQRSRLFRAGGRASSESNPRRGPTSEEEG